MKKIMYLFPLLLLLPSATVFATDNIPPKGIERISWCIKCSGKMPTGMIVAFGVLIALVIISVLYYKKVSGGEK